MNGARREGGQFDSERLASVLFDILGLPRGALFYAAYSGGLDSTVLLHALAALRERLGLRVRALHAHHGLQPEADQWMQHGQQFCERLAVPLTTRRLRVRRDPDRGWEASARRERYAWFAQLVGAGDVLMTGHHRDDQAETVLARLLRGAGALGMAGMPACQPFGAGKLARPLLDFPRAALLQYAQRHHLDWVDDRSNADLRYSRNFLRHRVVPLIQQRWPAAVETLARAADNMRDLERMAREVADEDLARTDIEQEPRFAGGAWKLRVSGIQALSRARLRNLMRYWLGQCGFDMPSARHLEQVLAQMIERQPPATAVCRWPGVTVRRYRDWLYLMPPDQAPDPRTRIHWDLRSPLELPAIRAVLVAKPSRGRGLAVYRSGKGVSVGWRQGGECCRPAGSAHHQAIKKLLQARGVPPWQRTRIPLVFIGGELAAVVGHWYCEPFTAGPDEPSIELALTSME